MRVAVSTSSDPLDMLKFDPYCLQSRERAATGLGQSLSEKSGDTKRVIRHPFRPPDGLTVNRSLPTYSSGSCPFSDWFARSLTTLIRIFDSSRQPLVPCRKPLKATWQPFLPTQTCAQFIADELLFKPRICSWHVVSEVVSNFCTHNVSCALKVAGNCGL